MKNYKDLLRDECAALIKVELDRVLNNCNFYLKEGALTKLHNEIGCLRGILYSMEAIGWNVMTDEVQAFIKVQNQLNEILR